MNLTQGSAGRRTRTSEDEDFQDGDEDVRGRQIFYFHGTPEDEDVQDGDEEVRGRQVLKFSKDVRGRGRLERGRGRSSPALL